MKRCTSAVIVLIRIRYRTASATGAIPSVAASPIYCGVAAALLVWNVGVLSVRIGCIALVSSILCEVSTRPWLLVFLLLLLLLLQL